MSNQENVFETILAPMTGTAVAITEVPDPIFIEKILGDGVAIVPAEGKVVSPVDGTVSKVAETGHIYAVTSDNGVEVVIHVGLETVALNGKCFQIHVKEGDKVKAGDLLADADLEFMKGKSLYVKREKFRLEKQLLWKLSRNKKSEDIVPESV